MTHIYWVVWKHAIKKRKKIKIKKKIVFEKSDFVVKLSLRGGVSRLYYNYVNMIQCT